MPLHDLARRMTAATRELAGSAGELVLTLATGTTGTNVGDLAVYLRLG